ncbi:MAG: glycosyltransferase [Bacteroidota bacterium]
MTPKKILFANVPADGHFNPLTTLAIHLLEQGHDVRWYTGKDYSDRIKKMGIRFYPCIKALDFTQENINELFPERNAIRSQVAKLKYDMKHVFILRSTEYFEDIKDIQRSFDFDLMIADVAFTAIPFVRHKLQKPVIAIGVFPLTESSVDLAPNGLGMTPLNTFAGRLKQRVLRYFTDAFIFRESKQLVDSLYRKYDMKALNENLFSLLCKEATLLLQSGTPGFEYYRSDLGKNIRFIGPLLPAKKQVQPLSFADKLKHFKHVVLVTQGTVEKDPAKIIVPTLEAFKNDPSVLVIATTGGSKTQELRQQYSQPNFIIEDFIPFDAVMPHTDVYVTNGGYGGVMLGIKNQIPMVVAGVHEGKNEICARVGYFNLGVNLKTETPAPKQVYNAVLEALYNPIYQQSVDRLQNEFNQYKPLELTDQYILEALQLENKQAVPKKYALFELEAA